jgi:UDP-N-acetyl-D-mannosaminuronate dehydrogenase
VTAIDRQAHSKAVTVPAFTDIGRQVEAKMTLDAGTDLVAVPVDLDLDDSFDKRAVEAVVENINSRIRKMNSVTTRSTLTPKTSRTAPTSTTSDPSCQLIPKAHAATGCPAGCTPARERAPDLAVRQTAQPEGFSTGVPS